MRVAEALVAAEAWAESAIWRLARRELAGRPRLAVLARDRRVAERAAQHVGDEWEVLVREARCGDLGLHDQLLGVHALLWATPAQAPLTAKERDILQQLDSAPSLRSVAVADVDLLDAMTEDPETELAEIHARIEQLLPTGWSLGPPPNPPPQLGEERTRAVGQHLLSQVAARVQSARDAVETEASRTAALLHEGAETLERARREASHASSVTLRACRKHTESLRVGLRSLLVELEAKLPEEMGALEDVALVRRALPHWLQHILDLHLDQALQDWHSQVLADLEALGVQGAVRDRVQLLHPPLHPPPVHVPMDWSGRLALTAALGAAALLAIAGMWVPSVVAVGGGVAWSSWTGGETAPQTREELIGAARCALRELGRHADRVFTEQLQGIERALEEVEVEQARSLNEALTAATQALHTHQAALETEAARLDDILSLLRSTP